MAISFGVGQCVVVRFVIGELSTGAGWVLLMGSHSGAGWTEATVVSDRLLGDPEQASMGKAASKAR